MSLSSHVEELKKKHASLSEAVDQAQRAPGVSDHEITSLKKQKLRLKDMIALIEDRLTPDIIA